MKIFKILLVALLISTFLSEPAIAAVPTVRWGSTVTGTADESSRAIAADSLGNYYLAGTSTSTLMTAGTFTANGNTSGAYDAFLAKYNSAGDVIWFKTFGTESSETIYSAAADSSNNVYVTGIFYGATFTIETATVTHSGSTYTDAFIAKFNPNGQLIWLKSIGGPSYDDIRKIVIDNSDNIFLIGFTGSNLVLGGSTITNQGRNDGLLVKMDSAGNFTWAKSFGGSGEDNGFALALDSAGFIYIAGTFNLGDLQIGNTNLVSAGGQDLFLAKLASNGDPIWATSIGGTGFESVLRLLLDTSGNIYLAGSSTSPSISISGTNLTNSGGYDGLLLKFSNSGTPLNGKMIGSTGNDFLSDVSIDSSGNIYGTGYFSGTVQFDGVNNKTSAGNTDAYIIKVNPSFNVLWAKTFGGTAADSASSIYRLTNGDLLVAGTYATQISIDNITLLNSGLADAVIVYVNSDVVTSTITLALSAQKYLKGNANSITATVDTAGKIKFYANGKVIPGCTAVTATYANSAYTATCSWKPSASGSAVLTARFTPSDPSYTPASAPAKNVAVGRRVGLR